MDCETGCAPEQEKETACPCREADRIIAEREGQLIETSTADPSVNLFGPNHTNKPNRKTSALKIPKTITIGCRRTLPRARAYPTRRRVSIS